MGMKDFGVRPEVTCILLVTFIGQNLVIPDLCFHEFHRLGVRGREWET